MQSTMGVDPRLYVTDPRMLSIMDAYVKTYGKMETDAVSDLSGFFLVEYAINSTQSVDTDVIKDFLNNNPPPFQLFTNVGKSILVARADLGNTHTNVIIGGGAPIGVIINGKVTIGPMISGKDQYLFTIKSNNLVDVYKASWLKYGYPKFPGSAVAPPTMHYSDFGITGQD